ncbi:Histidyl-tRNA synthetase [Cladobotryum mycophilum]|uniref:histidine--tRNA ligase n=1 Tax=Cladobotryum mycophilum TaxID=491253 RepID=A0ABR0SNM0_9HYPO
MSCFGETSDLRPQTQDHFSRCHSPENEDVRVGLDDMSLLVSYLEVMDVADKVSFDLSLARGLDYYSGLIYEVIPKMATQVGSIAAGGRYDGLVGIVDRIFTILDAQQKKKKGASDLKPNIDVYIMAVGDKEFNGLLLKRMALARQPWDAGIRAEFAAKVKPKTTQQFNASEGAPLIVILGQDELAAGQVRLKDTRASDVEEGQKDRGRLVSREDLVEEVKNLLSNVANE